jgi:hypothetical protein
MVLAATAHAEPRRAPDTIHVFHDTDIHFTPDDSTAFDTETVTARDNGRQALRTIELPAPMENEHLIARVRVRPIPKELIEVHDKWDRAGYVALRRDGMPDVEIVKFITSYGGTDDHEVDVTHLRPLLTGSCTIVGFIDTWSSPGWKMDLSFELRPRSTADVDEWAFFETRVPDFVAAVFNEQNVTEKSLSAGRPAQTVTVPAGLETMALYYLVSGHCTDGRGADEFEPKDNVIYVDGEETYRFKPWRSDCRHFRERNPYTRRWSNGTWSSDFSRSGWCPGDDVEPRKIDLSGSLSAGEHELSFGIEDVRPKDDSGHGYWRVSAVLVGWEPAEVPEP